MDPRRMIVSLNWLSKWGQNCPPLAEAVLLYWNTVPVYRDTYILRFEGDDPFHAHPERVQMVNDLHVKPDTLASTWIDPI